jgi:hypothetical protein
VDLDREMSGDERLGHIFGAGGPTTAPLDLTNYRRPTHTHLYPSTAVAWYFVLAAVVFPPLAVVAVVLGIRAWRLGNPRGWAPIVGAVLAVVVAMLWQPVILG